MEEINTEYLSKIEESISNLDELERFCEESAFKQQQIIEIQMLIASLKDHPKFLKIMDEVEMHERAKSLLFEAKNIKDVEDIGNQLEDAISNDIDKAFKLMLILGRLKFSLGWVEEVVLSMINHAKVALFPVFSEQFIEFIRDSHWPYQSKGEIISLKPETIAKFKDLFIKLLILKGIEYPSNILISKMKDQLIFHFLTERSTNKIDKPEWLLDYAVNSIKMNICYFLETFSIGPKAVEKILQQGISELVEVISKRIYHDTRIAIETNKEILFLHIIDKVLRFDLTLNELRSKECLLSKFMIEKKFIDVWIAYEKAYILIEANKIFAESSWLPENISGKKYNNLTEVILLHNSLVIKYSYVFVEDIKVKLIDSMNSAIIDSFINSYTEAFNYFKTFTIHYESNTELWANTCVKICALHQGCVLFQQFILIINKDYFAEEHFRINGLKKEIINKILQLILFTLEEIVSDYKKNSLWKERGSMRMKVVGKIVDELRQAATQELARLILSYTSQKLADFIAILFKNKPIDSKFAESASKDFKDLFVVLQDNTDRYEFLLPKILKHD